MRSAGKQMCNRTQGLDQRADAKTEWSRLDSRFGFAVAVASERGELSGRSRRISRFETTACTVAERAKPRISAQRISQVIPNVKLSARQTSCPIATENTIA